MRRWRMLDERARFGNPRDVAVFESTGQGSVRDEHPMSAPQQQPPHVYRPRTIADMSDRYFRLGDGRISGYASLTLGVLSFCAVLCYRFPSYLTTAELRNVYDPELLRVVLKIAMWAALSFGLLSFVFGQRRRLGALGVVFTFLGFALGGYAIPGRPVEPRRISLGLDWLVLDLLFSAALFIFIEKIVPKYEDQAILRPEWRLDLSYFALNHLLISVLLLVGNAFAPTIFGWAVNAKLQGLVSSLPTALQFVLLLVCADFVQYWCHRAFHSVPALWKIHAVHHSSEHMDWLAGSRSHLIEILIDRSLVMVPLYLLGADQAALDAYVLFAALQAVFVHANVRLEFGPLKYLLTTPQFHHWHHSSDKPAIDTNYAVHLPLYDKLFGTFHMPSEHWPAEYGTVTRLPRSFWGQWLYPFFRASK
jgi:sterol desaturase/sphingolipid hydroxylase (fatty acid hydroxylase superfamily)